MLQNITYQLIFCKILDIITLTSISKIRFRKISFLIGYIREIFFFDDIIGPHFKMIFDPIYKIVD